jgi:hypothetical protein
VAAVRTTPCPFCCLAQMNSGSPLLVTAHAITARPSYTNSYCVYKPSWNNFTNYPTSVLNITLMTLCERKREIQEERNYRVDAHLQMTSSPSSFNDFPHSILTLVLSLSFVLPSSSIASNFHIEATHSSHPGLSPSSRKLSDSARVQCIGLRIPYLASQSVYIHCCSPIYIYIYAQLLMKTTSSLSLCICIYVVAASGKFNRQILSVRYYKPRCVCTVLLVWSPVPAV